MEAAGDHFAGLTILSFWCIKDKTTLHNVYHPCISASCLFHAGNNDKAMYTINLWLQEPFNGMTYFCKVHISIRYVLNNLFHNALVQREVSQTWRTYCKHITSKWILIKLFFLIILKKNHCTRILVHPISSPLVNIT